MGTDHIKLLVADSQRLFAETLAVALGTFPGFKVIDEYPTTGAGTLEVAARHRPDALLLDYWIRGMGGPSTTLAVHAQLPSTKVLLLSWLHGRAEVQRAIAAGAVAFLPKASRLSQVAGAVQRAFAGEDFVFSEPLAQLIDAGEARADETQDICRRLLSLSPRELNVLQLLSEGLSAAQIASELAISRGTVKNHIHHILEKTATNSQLEAVAVARVGRMVGDPTRFPGRNRPRPTW